MKQLSFLLLLLWTLTNSDNRTTSQVKSSFLSRIRARDKRFIWYADRRFVLPPGSILILTPRLELPFIRQPPEGLNSDIQISWVFYMFFDKLGYTSQAHWWPPYYPFPSRNSSANITSNSPPLPNERGSPRGRRRIPPIISLPPKIEGGERAIIFPKIEFLLRSLGLDGRACILRATCEIQEVPLNEGFGLFGEILTLFFSNSPYAQSHLPEYLRAEEDGRRGDCNEYKKKCSKSIFKH